MNSDKLQRVKMKRMSSDFCESNTNKTNINIQGLQVNLDNRLSRLL